MKSNLKRNHFLTSKGFEYDRIYNIYDFKEPLISFTKLLTEPVNISNINAPNDHQSTSFPCPLLVNISGALQLQISWLNFTNNYMYKVIHYIFWSVCTRVNQVLTGFFLTLSRYSEYCNALIYVGWKLDVKWRGVNRFRSPEQNGC